MNCPASSRSPSTSLEDDPLLTETEVARMLGIQAQTLRQWRHRGSPALAFIAVGKFRKYRLSSVLKFLLDNTMTKTQPRTRHSKTNPAEQS